MTKLKKIDTLKNPNEQLKLYGFDEYFNLFIQLFNKKSLPRVSLISGAKGLGKSTFIYHFTNFLLSQNETYPYSVDKKEINNDNKSFKLLKASIHPNFFSLKNEKDEKNVSIEDVRKMIAFLNVSTLSSELKIVLIDNAEDLNINSLNAFLKSLEDVKENTFFFIITNNLSSLPQTVISRCIEFKIFLNQKKKLNIFSQLSKDRNFELKDEFLLNKLYYDTPGNLLTYYSLIESKNLNNYLEIIISYIQKYLRDKKIEDLSLISLLIEVFYNKLIISNHYNKFNLFFNRSKILAKISRYKKFNLDIKDTFFDIENILKNETT
jgi:DNA polymerase III subunit delta'